MEDVRLELWGYNSERSRRLFDEMVCPPCSGVTLLSGDVPTIVMNDPQASRPPEVDQSSLAGTRPCVPGACSRRTAQPVRRSVPMADKESRQPRRTAPIPCGFNIMLQAFPLDGKIVCREIAEGEEPTATVTPLRPAQPDRQSGTGRGKR